jgi:hypothetical protein
VAALFVCRRETLLETSALVVRSVRAGLARERAAAMAA